MGNESDRQHLIELQKINQNMKKLVALLGGNARQSSGNDNTVRASAHSQRGRQERAAVAGSATIPRSLLNSFGKLEKSVESATDKFIKLARAQSAYLDSLTDGARQNNRNRRNTQRDAGGSGNGNNRNNRNNRNDHDDDDDFDHNRHSNERRRRPGRPRRYTTPANVPRGRLVHGVGAHLNSSMTSTISDWFRRSPLANLGTLGGSFAMLSDGVKALVKEFHDLRQTGFRSKMFELNKESMVLGVSMKSLVEVVNSSKAQLNTMGFKPFMAFLEQAQDSAMALGMSTEEAMKFTASSLTSANNVGIAVGAGSESMKRILKSNEAAFAAMRATTNVTSEEFAKMTETLLSNNEVQKTLMGLNQKQKIQYIEGMNLERQRLAQLQLTVEQQSKILNAMLELSGMKIKDRYESAAKLAGAASMLGMGADKAGRAQQLLQKKNKTADEQKEFRELLTEMKQLEEEKRQSGAVGENLVDAISEQLGPLQKAIDDMAPAVQSQQGEKNLSEKTLADKIKDSMDGKLTVGLSKAYGVLESVLSNPLTKILAGVAGIGLAVIQLRRIANSVINIERNISHPSGQSRHDVRQRRLRRLQNARGGILGRGARALGGGVRDVALHSVGRIGLSQMGKVGLAVAGGSILGSLASTVNEMLTDAKDISMKSDVTGGLLEGGMALLGGPWTLGLTAVTKGVINGYKGWEKASEFFNTDAPTTGQKFASAAGGFFHGLTFGMLDGEKSSKFLYNATSTMGDIMSAAWDGMKTLGGYIANGFSYLAELPKKIFGYFVDWYAGMAKTGSKILGMLGFDGAEKAVNAKIDAARTALIGAPTDKKPTQVAQPTPATEVQPQPRQLGTQQQPINTATDTTKAADDKTNTNVAQKTTTPEQEQQKTAANSSTQKDASMNDVLAKLIELVELQKADTGINKEHLNAVKDLAPNKFGLTPSAFVRT